MKKGIIIDTGFKSFGEMSWDVIGEELIPNKIYFIYNPNCGWCQKQIEYFGMGWEGYVESGLTINCEKE